MIKYRRTIEGKWNLKGCHQFWSYFPVPSRSKRSFHGVFFLLLTIIEKRDASARKREKNRKKEKRTRSRQFPHSPLSHPRLVLKPFECTAAITLCRFSSYFLSQPNESVQHTRARTYLPRHICWRKRTRIGVARPFTPYRLGGWGKRSGNEKRRRRRRARRCCRRVATRVTDEFQKLKGVTK